MADYTFGFMNTKVKFKEDPKFIHIDETMRCLTYVFMHHIDIWIGLCQNNINSGTGYNAIVSLNINQTHNSVTIPISMSVTRVEGGI